MENNDYLESIKQAYEDKINLYERLIKSQDKTIEKQEGEITYLKKIVDKLLEELNLIKEQLKSIEKESKSITIEINNKNEGVNVSNTSDSSSGDKINYDLKGAKFGGGFAGRDYTGDVIHNYSSSELNDTIKEIQKLIDTLSQNSSTNSTSEQMKIATQVIERIENTPTWKQKAINAAKQGLLEVMKSNPIGAFVAGAIEGW